VLPARVLHTFRVPNARHGLEAPCYVFQETDFESSYKDEKLWKYSARV